MDEEIENEGDLWFIQKSVHGEYHIGRILDHKKRLIYIMHSASHGFYASEINIAMKWSDYFSMHPTHPGIIFLSKEKAIHILSHLKLISSEKCKWRDYGSE